jgi:hypothetical protein
VADLLNGLQTPELGNFEGDPNTDTVFEMSQKVKHNAELLDPLIGTIREIDTNMDSLESKGFTVGFVYGGAFRR